MESELDDQGNTTVGQLLEQMRDLKIRFPKVIINFFLNILSQKDQFEVSSDAEFIKSIKVSQIKPTDKLSFNKLQSFHQIFNRCPMYTAQTSNNSQNFKDAISSNFQNFNADKKLGIGYAIDNSPSTASPAVFQAYSAEEKKHIQNIIRQIHSRIEEKFKDYRRAFRHFDVNFDGQLSFQEFIAGCEFSGIHLGIKDSRYVFNTLDYDNEGSVDFKKFCLINTDKNKNIFRQIHETNQVKQDQQNKKQIKLLREKYDYLMQLNLNMHGKQAAMQNAEKLTEIKELLSQQDSKIEPKNIIEYHRFMTRQM